MNKKLVILAIQNQIENLAANIETLPLFNHPTREYSVALYKGKAYSIAATCASLEAICEDGAFYELECQAEGLIARLSQPCEV